MGACISCQTKEITPTTTSRMIKAWVIFPDGCLQGYSAAHARSSDQVLLDQKTKQLGETMFLCNADDLEFDGCFVGIGSEQVLQLGQMYFALPKSTLNRRIESDDMARLAVRASSALAKTGVVAVEFDTVAYTDPKKSAVAPVLEEKKPRRSQKGKAFAPELTAIAE